MRHGKTVGEPITKKKKQKTVDPYVTFPLAPPFLIVDRYKYWGSEIASEPPSVHYDEIMADNTGVGKWTAKIVSLNLLLPLRDYILICAAKIWILLRRWVSHFT